VRVDPFVLPKIARALLDRVRAVYAEAAIDLPSRQIWTIGEPVYDCEELVVSLIDLSEGLTQGDSPQSPCVVPINATFKVTVVRCAPVPDNRGNPPTPDALMRAADESAVDAYLLMKSSCKFDMWGADVDGLDPSALGGLGVNASIEVVEAQGGMQGVALNIVTVIG
jgi:hypothetical protein